MTAAILGGMFTFVRQLKANRCYHGSHFLKTARFSLGGEAIDWFVS